MTRTAVFTVTLSRPSEQQASVDFVTVDITAQSPDDYTASRGTLVFAAGEVSKTISVPVRDPIPGVPEQKFITTLYRGVNCTVIDPDGVATIPAGVSVMVNGPIIDNGLIVENFHNSTDLTGFFHSNVGLASSQFIAIESSLLAYQALSAGTTAEQHAAEWFRANAQSMLDAIGNGLLTGPILRQSVPDNPDTITLMHWLFASRGNIPSQGINYGLPATRNNNKLFIPANVPGHRGAADVFNVWQIYPATSRLLYDSPYSPAFDTQAPAENTGIRLSNSDWELTGSTITITLPESAPAGVSNWLIVYGYQNAGTIEQGEAMDIDPSWSSIQPGYVSAAPDSLRWFEYAMNLAMESDNRTGLPARWKKIRDAVRRSYVRGHNISDHREIIKPMPQYDALPFSGEPTGMFCSSNHPAAQPPSSGDIGAGANPSWTGFNFWSRTGGAGSPVQPGDFFWTPDNMQETPAGRNFFNGALKASVPATEIISRVLIGREISFSWRTATAFQSADQFMLVALSISRRPDYAGGERLYVFASSTSQYNVNTRWYAEIGQNTSLQPSENADNLCYVLIPRASFKKIDGDNSELPAGQRLENFGIMLEMKAEYSLQIVFMRLVSGDSEDSVRQNIYQASHGAPMPFFPGVSPMKINCDTIKQQFVGWNGSPFFGYQLPDLWWYLLNESAIGLPKLDPATNMPVTNASTGAIEYPINPVGGGITKPKNALLAEQQLMFLKRAQDQWVNDGGTSGPFAHTYVMNTADRMFLLDPEPHTWVYKNIIPNTEWVGYQVRVVNSLARLAFLSRNNPAWTSARQLASNMAISWIERINILWPNLDGNLFNDPDQGNITLYGMPTHFIDPQAGDPIARYEDPHAAALVLRACLWLNLSNLLTTPQQATIATVGKRCWDYLEMRYRAATLDTMRYTWANKTASTDEFYFSTWEFEIISTIAYLLKHPSGIPAGIDLSVLRQRLVDSQTWLVNNVR